MKDLLYRPDLMPEKKYMSDAEIRDSLLPQGETGGEGDENDDSVRLLEKAEDTDKKLQEILGIIEIIPKKERDIIERPLKLIHSEIEKLKEELVEKEKQNQGQEESSDPRPGFTALPDLPGISADKINLPNVPESSSGGFSMTPIIETIGIEVVPPVSITVMIRDSYLVDLVEIYRGFVLKLRLVVEEYVRDLLYIANLGGFDSYDDLFYEYGVPSLNLPENVRHMGDYIIKSQITRNQKARMLRKIYNIDQTVYHLRANKSAVELRQRYYGQSYRKVKGYLESESNNLLRLTRDEYDKKYYGAVKNFYKYLNGSAVLVNDMLKAFITEAKGKAALSLEGVDIHKFMQEEEALREKENKLIKDDYEKSRKDYAEAETKKLEKYKTAGIGAAGASDQYSNGSAPIIGAGDSNIAAIAIRWANERGLKSANPVIYSMGKRNGDMDLKRYGDCSSFTRKVCLEAGKGDIGSTTASQLSISNKKGQFIANLSDVKEGDLMYFRPSSSHAHSITLPNGQKSQVAHVGICVGRNRYVDLSYGQGGISNRDFGSYVPKYFIGAKRH